MNANVLRDYLDARYWADLPDGRLALTIGRAVEWRTRLETGAGCALITAYNPRSTLRPRIENEVAQESLRQRLDAVAGRTFAGAGESPDGTWMEPSWFALDISPRVAAALGLEFGQIAILAAGPGEPLLLHVLDPGLPAPPGMDTRFVRWLASDPDTTPR